MKEVVGTKPIALILVVFLLSDLQAQTNDSFIAGDEKEPLRIWRSALGLTVEARMVGRKGQLVELEKRDGSKIHVPISYLSKADQDRVRNKETSPSQSRNSSTAYDSIGNRVGKEHDWVKPGEFTGKRILIACYYLPSKRSWKMYENVARVLRDVGFNVDARYTSVQLPDLEGYDQCWIVSGDGGSRFGRKDVQAIRRFLSKGKGVYVLADDAPYLYEANVVSRALHKTAVRGNYAGFQVIHVLRGINGDMPKRNEDFGERRSQSLRKSGKYYAADHELLSGLNAIYEGQTISNIGESPKLHVVLRSSNNLPLVSVSRNDKERIVYDCGFTRMYANWEKHEVSSKRWFQNVAGYLMGKTRDELRGRTKQKGNRRR